MFGFVFISGMEPMCRSGKPQCQVVDGQSAVVIPTPLSGLGYTPLVYCASISSWKSDPH